VKSLIGVLAIAAMVVFASVISPLSATGSDPVIAAVGDIACPVGAAVTSTACHQQAVGNLIRSKSVTNLLVLGDIQYNLGQLVLGSPYDKAFGTLNLITKPVPGNHEYGTTNAQPYSDYFNDPAPYWYSYDVGMWHMIAIDSNCSKPAVGTCSATSNEGKFLLADLAADSSACTIAYWHHPRYNSGEHGGATNMTWIWKTLYNNNVDIVLNGHEHSYQRFAPLNASGVRSAGGMTEFVVGTGGKSHYAGGSTSSLSEYRNTTDFGALFLTLHATSADYQFITENNVIKDSGTINCR